jgi:hypothetical protein
MFGIISFGTGKSVFHFSRNGISQLRGRNTWSARNATSSSFPKKSFSACATHVEKAYGTSAETWVSIHTETFID